MKALIPHLGESIDLPEGTPPDAAKASVKAHIAKRNIELNKSAEKDKQDDARHKANVAAKQDIAKTMAVGMDALGKRLDTSSVSLKSLASKLDPLADLAKSIDGFSSNVESLEKCIEKCTSEIIKIMKAPKKILTNTKGKPTGMAVSDE